MFHFLTGHMIHQISIRRYRKRRPEKVMATIMFTALMSGLSPFYDSLNATGMI